MYIKTRVPLLFAAQMRLASRVRRRVIRCASFFFSLPCAQRLGIRDALLKGGHVLARKEETALYSPLFCRRQERARGSMLAYNKMAGFTRGA